MNTYNKTSSYHVFVETIVLRLPARDSSPNLLLLGTSGACNGLSCMLITTTRRPLMAKHPYPLITRIRQLRLREERERTGLFYIEGMRLLAQAMNHQAPIETVIVCRDLLIHPFAQKLALLHERRRTPILEITADAMKSISHMQDSQGIGALVQQRWQRLEQVRIRKKLCWIAVETIRSPGNLGTILRTSEAVGGAGILLLGNSTDPYDPGTVRATMGAMFSQRFVRTSIAELASWKRRGQYQLVGTSPTATQDYHKAHYIAPTILFMGEERKGLSPALQAMCDLMVSIPMVGEGDSLNVAMATGVMLYELFNQQRATIQ